MQKMSSFVEMQTSSALDLASQPMLEYCCLSGFSKEPLVLIRSISRQVEINNFGHSVMSESCWPEC